MIDKYIYNAVHKFGQLAGLQTELTLIKGGDDYLIRIRQVDFIVSARREIRKSSKGIVFQQIKELSNRSAHPIVVISNYIALEVANEFRQNGINYLDSSGNSYVKHDDLLIYISGQKAQNVLLTNQTRAFRESGLKLIFHLMNQPENIHLTNRQLAELSGISVGSVSHVLTELESLNFVLKTGNDRFLKNTRLLLDRWITSYHDVFRPRLQMKRMDFEFAGDRISWENLPLQNAKGRCLWGGEPAAAIMTSNLNPAFFTLYTDQNWQEISKDVRLIPNESGNFEILEIFWREEGLVGLKGLVPALLIYADLIGSGVERNIQIANEILENDLQYIK